MDCNELKSEVMVHSDETKDEDGREVEQGWTQEVLEKKK